MRTIPFVLIIASMLSGCKKEPGSGGLAQIAGTVIRQDINNVTGQPMGTPYPDPADHVYLSYGSHTYPDVDNKTGPDGTYNFSWLRTGDYTVYVYSRCITCPSGQQVISNAVHINGGSDVVTVPTMYINH